MGDVADFRTFVGAVIDRSAFDRASAAISRTARHNADDRPGWKGRTDSAGYFIEPTLVGDGQAGVPAAVRGNLRSGDDRLPISRQRSGREMLEVVERTSPYALTGFGVQRERSRRSSGHERAAQCGQATSTSTTNPRARSSVSSRSGGPADRARTTKPDRRRTCCAGSARER